jgi:hypothetical protein
MFAMIFKCFQELFSSISEGCFKCFICLLLYVASVASQYFSKADRASVMGLHLDGVDEIFGSVSQLHGD